MIITRYGIRLIRIEEHHLELIRYWRNSDKIRSVMEFRHHITLNMQWKWFLSLEPLRDFYFIIEYREIYIGLIHIAKVDWSYQNGQAGLFIWNDNYIGTPIPVMASVNLLDTFFYFFSICSIEAKVKSDNKTAISYNTRLGFQEIADSEKKEFFFMELTKERYNRVVHTIKELVGDAPDSLPHIFIPAWLYNQIHLAGIAVSASYPESKILIE